MAKEPIYELKEDEKYFVKSLVDNETCNINQLPLRFRAVASHIVGE